MKNLIKGLLMACCFAWPAVQLHAQTTTGNDGVYLSAEDYRQNKLSYPLSKHDKLYLHEFLEGKNVTLRYEGKKVKLPKSSIFGYQWQGQNFRLYHNVSYRILDTTGFILYTREKLIPANKGFKESASYAYSLDLQQEPSALSMENLDLSFSSAAGFRYALQCNFKTDEELSSYDSLSHQYKIQYLYHQFNNKTTQPAYTAVKP